MFAVQPAAWSTFDEHGAEYSASIHSAYRIGQMWGEPCMIWRLTSGHPIKWCRCDANSNAIADLVFGVPKS